MVNKNQKNRLWIRGILLFVIAGVLVFLVSLLNQKETSEERYGIWFSPTKPVLPFTLESTQGGTLTQDNLKGQWTFIFLGYTRCPDICPTTMKLLHEVYINLKEKGVKPLPSVIFVSLDPQRDSVENVKQYVEAFDPHFIGLTGSPEAINKFAENMGIFQKSMNDGTIQHSGVVTVINPKGEVAAVFVSPKDADKMAADYEAAVGNR